MALRDRILRYLDGGEKAQVALPVQTSTIGARQARPNLTNYKALVTEGLYKNAAVQGCISALNSTMNEAPLVVVDANGEPVPNHPLTRVFSRPNAGMSQAMFWKYVTTYIHTGGNCYIHKVRNELGQIIALVPYHDGQFVAVPGEYDFISHYVYMVNGTERIIPVADVIQLRWGIDPLNPVKGLSPIDLAGVKIQTENELDETIYSVMKNNAVPGTIIRSQSMLNEQQRNMLRESFAANHGGDNKGTVSVLTGDLSIERIAMSMAELQADGIYGQLESAICGIFRVHPVVAMSYAGLISSTYSNMETAFREFTTLTRVPMWNDWEEQLALGLYGELAGLKLNFDTTQVAALKSDPDAVLYPVIAMFNANIITQNEARERTGGEPYEGGDVFLYELIPAPAPFGAMDAGEEVETKEADHTALFTTKDGVRTLNEVKAKETWKEIDDANEEHGDTYEPFVQELVKSVTKAAIGSSKAAKGLDPKNINVQEQVKRFMAATETVRASMIQEIVELAMKDVTNADLVNITTLVDEMKANVNAEVAAKMTQATETMKKKVRHIIDKNADLPTSELAAALRKGMEEAYTGQAEVIARTTARAQTTTTQLSTWQGYNKRQDDPKKKLVKVWISMRDDVVRESHEDVDGEVKELNENFQVGSDSMKGPGKGSEPEENINCRCIITTIERGQLD